MTDSTDAPAIPENTVDDQGISDASCNAVLLDGYARDADRKGLPATAASLRLSAEFVRGYDRLTTAPKVAPSTLPSAASVQERASDPARIWLSPACDNDADHGEGRLWAAPAPESECDDCGLPWIEYVRADLAREAAPLTASAGNVQPSGALLMCDQTGGRMWTSWPVPQFQQEQAESLYGDKGGYRTVPLYALPTSQEAT